MYVFADRVPSHAEYESVDYEHRGSEQTAASKMPLCIRLMGLIVITLMCIEKKIVIGNP